VGFAKQSIGEKNKAGWTPERRAAWSEYKKLNNGMKGRHDIVPWNKGILRNQVMLPADFEMWGSNCVAGAAPVQTLY
jgi:hypothetical protein